MGIAKLKKGEVENQPKIKNSKEEKHIGKPKEGVGQK